MAPARAVGGGCRVAEECRAYALRRPGKRAGQAESTAPGRVLHSMQLILVDWGSDVLGRDEFAVRTGPESGTAARGCLHKPAGSSTGRLNQTAAPLPRWRLTAPQVLLRHRNHLKPPRLGSETHACVSGDEDGRSTHVAQLFATLEDLLVCVRRPYTPAFFHGHLDGDVLGPPADSSSDPHSRLKRRRARSARSARLAYFFSSSSSITHKGIIRRTSSCLTNVGQATSHGGS